MRLAIAGGGTGGHLFPGLALADLALSSGRAESVVFFGAERGIEARVVPEAGYELIAQPLEGLRGRGVVAGLGALLRLVVAVIAASREIRRRRVEVLVGLGGYASAAGVIAARLAGVPVVLLEQNRTPGLSNRLFARLAAAVCTSFAETSSVLGAERVTLTGNPLRAELESFERVASGDRGMLLVFGGSGGAASLNRAVVAALATVAASLELPPILHQSGSAGLAGLRESYAALGIKAEVCEFIDDMAAAYAGARLAICRAGATTVAELVATATPALLLPFPHAAGDHQSANARALEAAGAAVRIADDEQAAENLAQALLRLLRDSDGLDSMSAGAASLKRPGATARVLEVVWGVSRGK